MILKANDGLYRCYYTLQNLPLALKYYIQFSETEKKKLQAENSRQLAELRISFESERREKDIEFLRTENELNEMSIKRKSALMWLFLIALAFAVSLLVFIYGRFKNKNKANRELKLLNEKILEQNREFDRLNKELELVNTEKDKIFSIIAHELRNPLFWFQNLAEVLSVKFQTMSPEKMKKSLTALDESAKNAFHLMDNLLHWSRSRLNRITPKKSPQSLEKLVSEATRMYGSIIKQKEIVLETDIPSGIVIKADPDLFTCVVRNIISNAIKFTPSKGYIKIACSTSNYEVKIRISDSGIGIPNKQLSRLFDINQAYSVPGLLNEKGSGLGLKICKEFTELNDGRIWVSSETGKGTHFEFTVPEYLNGNEVLTCDFPN
ncbi:MAG: HAMP domain-containing histidine kinase [Bacteroidales bacterium]|nr:HAMP domain-containing histidine kinase [Bacteroidales bacterium]